MSTPSPEPSFWSKINPSHWLALILAVVAILFVLQNRQEVSADLFWVSVQSPLWLILIVMFAIGWLSGYLATRRRTNAKQAAKRPSRK